MRLTWQSGAGNFSPYRVVTQHPVRRFTRRCLHTQCESCALLRFMLINSPYLYDQDVNPCPGIVVCNYRLTDTSCPPAVVRVRTGELRDQRWLVGRHLHWILRCWITAFDLLAQAPAEAEFQR